MRALAILANFAITIKDIVAIGEGPDAIIGIKQSDDSKTEYYDLTGRKVLQPQKGIYIRNGKNVIVK